jgi:hypothetical protein
MEARTMPDDRPHTTCGTPSDAAPGPEVIASDSRKEHVAQKIADLERHLRDLEAKIHELRVFMMRR